MNVLGHPYIAWRIFPTLNVDHLVGSWLPDLVPFVPNSVFEFQEIHEGGQALFNFLKINYSQHTGLALGMLSHGTTYGADKFSPTLENKYESKRAEITQKIIQATPNLRGNERALKGRFHNFLWWGVDVQILRNEGQFMRQLKTLIPQINIPMSSKLLAECFHKSEPEVERMVKFLLGSLSVERTSSVIGLAGIWRQVASGLPEEDQVDVEKTVKVFEYCSELIGNDWRNIVDEIVNQVTKNMQKLS